MSGMDQTYPDDDMLRSTGLDIHSVRKLTAWGAAKPVTHRRGVVRQWDRQTIRRIARVAAIVRAGLSLPLAHTLTYLYILDERFDLIDPDAKPEFDDTEWTWADRFGWFDANRPLNGRELTDMYITIVDGDRVFQEMGPVVNDDTEINYAMIGRIVGHQFLTGMNFQRYEKHEIPTPIRPKWQPTPRKNEINPASLSWVYVPAMTTEGAEDAFRNPVSVTRVNLSFACRVAMRRLLNIPVFFEGGQS